MTRLSQSLPLCLALAAATAISACSPAARPWTDLPRKGGDGPSQMVAPPAATPVPPKPAPTPKPPPPNVIRVVLPDGTVRIIIREPRCPNCVPWTF